MEEDHRIELSPLPVDRISSPVSFQSIDLPELVENILEVSPMKQITAHLLHRVNVLLLALRVRYLP